MIFIAFVKELSKQKIAASPIIKRVSGTILTETDEYGKASVQCLGASSNCIISLLNKTGENLNIGDNVWIYYWNNISDGYIAVRVGVADWTKGISSSIGLPKYMGDLPVYQKTTINAAYLLHEQEKEYKTIYNYKTEDKPQIASQMTGANVGEIVELGFSEYRQQYVYESSGAMNDGTTIFFSWIPHSTEVLDVSDCFHPYQSMTLNQYNVATGKIVTMKYLLKTATYVDGRNYVYGVRIYEDGYEEILFNYAFGDISNFGFALLMGTTNDTLPMPGSGNHITYIPQISSMVYNLTIYSAHYTDGHWYIDNGYNALRETIMVVASPSLSPVISSNNSILVSETTQRSEL